MHPALSIVFFTTASGAGFGLLLLLGLSAPLGWLPDSGWFAFVALATAAVLAVGGLGSSVFHLGRPERSWRAFSQWRSSWLSREGVFAALTFLPTIIFGIGWVFFGRSPGFRRTMRGDRRGSCCRNALLHWDDLRLAEANSPMAQ